MNYKTIDFKTKRGYLTKKINNFFFNFITTVSTSVMVFDYLVNLINTRKRTERWYSCSFDIKSSFVLVGVSSGVIIGGGDKVFDPAIGFFSFFNTSTISNQKLSNRFKFWRILLFCKQQLFLQYFLSKITTLPKFVVSSRVLSVTVTWISRFTIRIFAIISRDLTIYS